MILFNPKDGSEVIVDQNQCAAFIADGYTKIKKASYAKVEAEVPSDLVEESTEQVPTSDQKAVKPRRGVK